MVERLITIPATATVLDACEFFILHRLLAFPIVDEERRILGTVDVHLYTDELSSRVDSRDNCPRFLNGVSAWQICEGIGNHQTAGGGQKA